MAIQSAMEGVSNNMSLPKTAAPGEDFSTIWYIEQIAQEAATKKSSNISADQVSCISRLAVRNMSVKTPCIRSSIVFACGFLTVVGLSSSPHDLHRAWKLSLNLLPLSYMIFLSLG